MLFALQAEHFIGGAIGLGLGLCVVILGRKVARSHSKRN